MKLDFDPAKSEKNARERGLPFELATEIFTSVNVTFEDNRADYGETRFITVGFIAGRMAVVVWTPRGTVSRIISMRYANGREIEKYKTKLG
ncbi:MAG: BrnT family toxin [Desulfurivibrionaceae bacterium]